MSEENKVDVQVEPSVPALLTILFIALKLTHVIDWSWLWVLSPLWLGLAVLLAFFFWLIWL